MNQQELEALLAEIAPGPNDPTTGQKVGQPARLVLSESTETVEVPDPDNPSAGAKKKVPVKVLTWVDPGTGMTLKVQATPGADGAYTYTKISQGIDPKQQGEPATTPAQAAKDEQGTEIGSRQSTDASGNTVKITTYRRPDGTTYDRTDSVQAAPEKPQPGKPYKNAQGQWVVPSVDASGTVTTKPLPPEAIPQTPSERVNLPPTQKWDVRDNGDGTFTTTKNPNYVKPSKIGPHPGDPTKMVEFTEDDEGRPIILPVNDQTVIKPADLPVLQTKYGEVASGLGALAKDLNQRVAAGTMTAEQRKEAWTAAYQQAQTQVSEINSILDNSRAIWAGEVQQRGQTLGETQSRRSYASDIFNRAHATGLAVGESAGPGHGKAIAAGVGAMMRMGQRYAEGMGGFRESPEVGLPPALQQARGMGLPGMAMPASAGAGTPPAGMPPPPGSPLDSRPAVPPPAGITDTTDIGGAPREFTPSSATTPGLSPVASLIGGQLQAGMGAVGGPVAAGGAGMWDPMAEAQNMAGDGADPTWAEAVRRAAEEVGQPGGYAWDRFRQPASRFGV